MCHYLHKFVLNYRKSVSWTLITYLDISTWYPWKHYNELLLCLSMLMDFARSWCPLVGTLGSVIPDLVTCPQERMKLQWEHLVDIITWIGGIFMRMGINIDALAQDCSNSIANALGSSTSKSLCTFSVHFLFWWSVVISVDFTSVKQGYLFHIAVDRVLAKQPWGRLNDPMNLQWTYNIYTYIYIFKQITRETCAHFVVYSAFIIRMPISNISTRAFLQARLL